MKKYFYSFSCALFLFICQANAQVITTIAGNGAAGYNGDNIAATTASLGPSDVKVDAHGNIFVVDEGNGRIRKIDSNNVITTVAGTGDAGYNGDSIAATSAQLNNPNNIALDKWGNIYIADGPNNRIRKVDTLGIITTVAGAGYAGFSGDGGPAVDASLLDPYGVAVDTAGNIYIADSYNNVIRKVTTDGVINTIAGNGTIGFSGDGGDALSAELSWPTRVCTDVHGNVYISDYENNRIRKISTAGIITTVVGSGVTGLSPGSFTGSYTGDGGLATAATLNAPMCVAFDRYGNMYISDNGNNCIRKVDTLGVITTICGNGTAGFSGDGSIATGAELNQPSGIVPDYNGNLLFADGNNNRIRTFRINAPEAIVPVSAISDHIDVYPNPNSGTFTINVTAANESHATITIINALGQKVNGQSVFTNRSVNIAAHLPAGVYMLTSTTSAHTFSRQITIE